MSDVAIIYASTSGRTRKVVSQIESQLLPLAVESFDLREVELHNFREHTVLLFGSPTYGTGDWHYLWQIWSERIIDSRDWIGQRIGLFVLGDAKHHGETFAGALTHLQSLVRTLQAELIAQVEYEQTYDRDKCRALLSNDCFAGLVLDQISQRRLSDERIKNWVPLIKSEFLRPTNEP